MPSGITVAVLGGSGLIGQHLIRELQDWPEVAEIKVIDIKQFNNFLDYEPRVNPAFIRCDILQKEELTKALKGVTGVFHCASKEPMHYYDSDYEDKIYHQVNVKGTENVIKACQAANVEVLVYSGSMAVVCGGAIVVHHTEAHTTQTKDHNLIFGGYAISRRRAEEAVLNANNAVTASGKKLQTIAMRVGLVYGEGEKRFVSRFIEAGRLNDNKITRLCGGKRGINCSQMTYAGNVADGHVHAMKNLLSGKHSGQVTDCSGKPVYMVDETPAADIFQLVTPFLQPNGIEIVDAVWHIVILSFMLRLKEIVFRFYKLIFPNAKVSAKTRLAVSYRLLVFISGVYVASGLRMSANMDYRSKYSTSQAIEKANVFYSEMDGKKVK